MDANSIPTTAQMVIDIQDNSVIKDLKRILARINGIGKITVRKNYYESAEFYQDIDAAEADIANGKGVRVNSKESLEALFS